MKSLMACVVALCLFVACSQVEAGTFSRTKTRHVHRQVTATKASSGCDCAVCTCVGCDCAVKSYKTVVKVRHL